MEKLNVKDLLFNDNKNYLCIIAGCSGSGKSHFEEKLVKIFPDYFNKLPQITTRKCRGIDDNGYYFVSEEVYDYMKNSLIARLDSFNNKKYGTIPVFTKNKINTVIASYDAIKDLFDFINSKKLSIIPIMILFDIDEKNITSTGKRIDRDSSFLQKEKNELLNVFNIYKDQCIFSKIYKYEDFGRFAEISDIIKF